MRNKSVSTRRAARANGDLTIFVRAFIASSLASGDTTIAGAAEAAGMGVRTLQRRLMEAGLTYHRLLDEVRLETAKRLLIRSETSIAEAAAALGYSDSAHFTRAFRRWTGEMPSAFRRCHREDGERRT